MSFSASAQAYDLLHDPVSRWQREGALLTSWVQGGTRVLDMGCGSGQHTHRLAAAFPAITIVGCDPSAEMLALAQGRQSPALFTSGALNAPPAGLFDRVLLIGNTLSLLTEADEMRAALITLRSVMPVGGLLLVQILAADGPSLHAPRHTEVDGTIDGSPVLVRKSLYPGEAGAYRLELSATTQTDQQIIFSETHHLRAWSLAELRAAGARANLKHRRLWGGLDASLLDQPGANLVMEFLAT